MRKILAISILGLVLMVFLALGVCATKGIDILNTSVSMTGNVSQTLSGSIDITNTGDETEDIAFLGNMLRGASGKDNLTIIIQSLPGLTNGTTKSQDFNIVISGDKYADTYTGKLVAYISYPYNTSINDSVSFSVIVNDNPAISVSSNTPTIIQGKTNYLNVTVTNTGNMDITGGSYVTSIYLRHESDQSKTIPISPSSGLVNVNYKNSTVLAFPLSALSNQQTGTYRGNITITYYTGKTETYYLAANVVDATEILTVPSSVSGTAIRTIDSSKQIEFTLTNTGSLDLTNVAITVANGVLNLSTNTSKTLASSVSVAASIKAGESKTATLTVSGITSASALGNYIGAMNVTYGTGKSASIPVTFNLRDPSYGLTISPSPVTFSEDDRNTSTSASFKIINTGEVTLNNIQIDASSIASKYNISFSTTAVASLAKDAEQAITVTAFIPKDEDSGEHKIGTVKVTSDKTNTSFDLRINPKSELIFRDIDVTIGGETDGALHNEDNGYTIDVAARPGDKVKLAFKLKNNYNTDEHIDINDITITATIDELDIEETSDEFTLKEQKTSNEIVLMIDIPLDVDEGEYVLDVTAEGEDDDDNNQKASKYFNLQVEKESTDLRIYKAALSPSTVSCYRSTTLDVEVINFGVGDEDDVVVIVKGTELGLDAKEEVGTLTDDLSDEDSMFKKHYYIDVTKSLAAGTYKIQVQAFRNTDDSEDFEEVILTVNACTQPTNATDGTTTDETGGTTGGEVIVIEPTTQPGTATTQPATTIREKTSAFLNSNAYITVLVVACVAVIGLIIAGISALARRH